MNQINENKELKKKFDKLILKFLFFLTVITPILLIMGLVATGKL